MMASEKDEGVVKKNKVNNSVLDEYAGEDKKKRLKERKRKKRQPMHRSPL